MGASDGPLSGGSCDVCVLSRCALVVGVSSGAGLRPSLTGIHAYTAAKHALVGLTKQLSLELAPHGVTVNSIAPGFVLSNPTTQKQWESYGPEGQAELVSRIHTRRLGKPEDIAAAVGPVKYFSRSLTGVSLIAILVILFFVILKIIPFSLNSFLNSSNSTTFNPWY